MLKFLNDSSEVLFN